MTPEVTLLKSKGLSDTLAEAAEKFLTKGDPLIPQNAGPSGGWIGRDENVGVALVRECPWNEATRTLVRFFIHYATAPGAPMEVAFLLGVLRGLHTDKTRSNTGMEQDVVALIHEHHPALRSLALEYLKGISSARCDWSLDPTGRPQAPFVSPLANWVYAEVSNFGAADMETLTSHPDMFAALACHQPRVTREWARISYKMGWNAPRVWRVIIHASRDYDDLCLESCELMRKAEAKSAFDILHALSQARDEAHFDRVLDMAEEPHAALGATALGLLLQHREHEVVKIMTRAFASQRATDHISLFNGLEYAGLFRKLIQAWDQGGRDLLALIISQMSRFWLATIFDTHLLQLSPACLPAVREMFLQRIAQEETRDLPDYWSIVAGSHAAAFLADFESLLTGKSKPLRELAANVLVAQRGAAFAQQAAALFASKKSDARLGATAFFAQLADASWLPVLQAALEAESSEAVRAAIHLACRACGQTETATVSAPTDAGELLASVLKQAAKLKMPAAKWLQADALPALPMTDGSALPPDAITFLFAKQSKHKDITAAPDIVPLQGLIDRSHSAPFAAALVEGFLNSEQAAADRWALTLGGLLGDNRIIALLLPRIQGWCENARHKLAEYAAQAISLLPGNDPLMVLDMLATRYRSKFKNIGKACGDAFNAAASARGITPDELGDLVVPTFDFDADGLRHFAWNGGGAIAELGADFKLSWSDPETEKSWKSLPSSAPAEIKDEVKTLGKLMREAVKGQTARHEQALVRQRRWPVARWRELYESHPLLRSFASGLVWGIYDKSGIWRRSFRRYPNGLLADASGALEELPESDTFIGMIHPLELDEAQLAAWRGHLARFKIKPPFPQIDRPVELLDPLHGNRRKITFTEGRSLGAGTFKSRSEKRGWLRGSVIDAGGISSVYKAFPGAGVEVILMMDNYWIGIDPMDTVETGAAFFVNINTVERGSYAYDEPAADDPRVLRFDQVPPVVWSETLSDLKAIIGEKP